MTFVRYRTANRARGNLLASISAGATSMTLESGDGNAFPSSYPYMLNIEELDVNGVVTSYEVVKVTNKSGDTFTIVRAQEGTSGTAFDAGDQVSLYMTKELIDDIQAEIARLETDKLNLSAGLRTGLTAYRTYISNGSGAETAVVHGTSGRVFTSNGASANPSWEVPTVDIDGLAEDASPDFLNDYVLTRDTSASANKKVKPLNLIYTHLYEAGTGFLLASMTTEETTNSTSYTKLKEAVAQGAGVISYSGQFKSYSGSYTGYARVYINGVATGSEHTNATGSYTAFSGTVTVAEGDLVQIYCKHSTASFPMSVKDVYLKADITYIPGITWTVNNS